MMDIIVRSPGVKLNDRTHIAIQKQLEKLEHLLPGLIICEVLAIREKDSKAKPCIVQARVVMPGNDLFAKEHGRNYVHAARLLSKDLENQIRKIKEQRVVHGKEATPPLETAAEEE
jgi:ribosome-associated translation inhibitor RaiA